MASASGSGAKAGGGRRGGGAASRRERGSASRQRLIEVGVTALRRGGYHGTGLANVLAGADLPKGSFYHHFPSKEAFAAEAVRCFGEQVTELLDQALARRPDDPLRGLQDFFGGLCEQYAREGSALGCLLGTLGQEVGASNRALAEVLRAYLDAIRARCVAAIGEAQRLGSARRDVEAAALGDWLANGWHGALIRMKVEGRTEPARQFVASFFGFLRTAPEPRGRRRRGP